MITSDPEKNLIQKEINKEREKLINEIKKDTFKLIGNIVPIDENLRIKVEEYKNIYPEEEIERDKEEVNKLKSSFNKNQENQIRKGEVLEILKTYLFNKFRGNVFICTRTSEYDDYFNHIDNLILNKETGEVICALDETLDINSERFEKKKYYILKRNLKGGVEVKYFLQLKENKAIPSNSEVVPIILIAIPEHFLNKLLDLMIQNKEKEFIKNVFVFFSGIKTLIEFYILPPLEKELEALQQSNLEKANTLRSVINKITSFKNYLEEEK